MKSIRQHSSRFLSILLLIALIQSVYAEEKKPVVELTHWWNSPGELQALATIKSAVETQGATFIDTRISSWYKLRTSVINRLTLGYPPAITQWLSDQDIFELSGINAIDSTASTWRGKAIKDILIPEVYARNTQDGKLISLPVGIHVQNNALFNAAIYRELKLKTPDSWRQVLEQAPIIQQAGYIPIALSKEIWQLKMVFNTILLEQIGNTEDYQAFYTKKFPVARWREQLETSFAIMLELKKFADPEHNQRTWNQAVRLLGKKKAAMHVLGDFANSELTAMGLTAGKDFLCSLSPGAQDNMIYAIDVFLMLKVEERYLKKGQQILFDTILDPTVQAHYSSLKGSTPVRYGIDPEKLDACSRARYQQWTSPTKKSISFSEDANDLRISFVKNILQRAWGTNITPRQLVNDLIAMEESARE